jgi:hypothetical protein
MGFFGPVAPAPHVASVAGCEGSFGNVYINGYLPVKLEPLPFSLEVVED